jgi:hypothetical protein
MTEKNNGFAEACYNDNSITELLEGLKQPAADETDCKTWSITPTEWREAIIKALNAKVANLTDDELGDILERTEYTENGVALGDGAAHDQDMRRLAQKELGRRMYGDDA